MAHKDPIIEEVWKSREKLLEQHGGLEGFLEHIEKQEQEHPEKLIDPNRLRTKKIKLQNDSHPKNLKRSTL